MKEDQANKNTQGQSRSDNAPEIVLRDGALRSATWQSEGEYGPLFNTRITKLYRDDEGNPRETSTLGSKDLLRVSELARETHREVLSRQRSHSQEKQAPKTQDEQQEFAEEWHDEDRSRKEIARDRFKEERSPAKASRRSKPRDRTAR